MKKSMTGGMLLTLIALSAPMRAQIPVDGPDSPVRRSAPVAQAEAPRSLPPSQDVPWPGGTMRLEVDTTDTARRIVRIRQTIGLPPGLDRITLLSPQWLPGQHSPRGEIEKLAGLRFSAGSKPLEWQRDLTNPYAFHVTLPAGTRELTAQFQYLAATEPDQGRIKFTDRMMNLQWENLSLYPVGYYVRRIPVQATVTYPAGWQAAAALRGVRTGNSIAYAATDYETLIDSPVFAGLHSLTFPIRDTVTIATFADDPAELVATRDQTERHGKLVDEALALFGARHYDRYDFLLAITDQMGRIGLEHHRSSENAVEPGYFTKWNDGPGDRNLLPHEFVHSWNGKFRRPASLWTPDYHTPMRDNLLWVYEGQTQFWGYVLGARSGITSKAQTLDAIAAIAARLDYTRGRTWRPVADTTSDPVISGRRPKGWIDWQRNEDYYNEGLMIWLEADAIIQKGSGGTKGIDDFARAFFGLTDGDWGEVTYDRADIVRGLNAVYRYDWDGFLRQRIDGLSPEVTKAGIDLGGYSLVYGETPNSAIQFRETARHLVDQSFGIGLVVRDDGAIDQVIWDSAAFKAGLTTADRIIAIDGTEWSRKLFLDSLRAARDQKEALQLLVKRGKQFTTFPLAYSGGIRYPRLQKTSPGEGSLDRLLKPKTAAAVSASGQ